MPNHMILQGREHILQRLQASGVLSPQAIYLLFADMLPCFQISTKVEPATAQSSAPL